ncbi:hypothetical protein KORDIASMS9_02675 [Kordia sp. SMS9]|uniref:hypothetical protein n=1 Tax=Kordia sp. SMS9 TaxID=2282170 RepID=UPI000E0D179D|nr:hypothetical protein [Kordia sp. SMS9]AXG70435.1 hypothetical protein KORDIASMS9_02675 [Kordia sp. SMS9]
MAKDKDLKESSSKSLTDAERKAFLEKYDRKKLRIIELPLDDYDSEFMEAVVLVPSRTVMGQYMKYIDQNPKRAQDILLKGSLLNNKEVIMSDDALANTAVSLIAELLPIREGRIKKF